jgi:hypothetical protein
MREIAQFSPSNASTLNVSNDLATGLWSISKRLLAALAVVAFTYAVFAVDVELNASEHITDPYPR